MDGWRCIYVRFWAANDSVVDDGLPPSASDHELIEAIHSQDSLLSCRLRNKTKFLNNSDFGIEGLHTSIVIVKSERCKRRHILYKYLGFFY